MKDINKKWEKRGSCKNIRDYISETTGQSPEMIISSGRMSYACPGIHEAALRLHKAAMDGRPVHAVVDYDADGLGAGAELYMVFKKMGIRGFKITIPKRFSDGYGMNPDIVRKIPANAFVMTVDNGISAITAIQDAKKRGMEVVVLDHHQRNGILPPADLIVDPEDQPAGWDSPHYCGAGLVYKLAEELFPGDGLFLDQLSSLACISTIADSVNVLGDNRNIILRGLKNLNQCNCPEGLAAVLKLLGEKESLENIGIREIGFKVAPMLNAPGRLHDEGGIFTLNCLFSRGNGAVAAAEKLYQINEQRKDLILQAKQNIKENHPGYIIWGDKTRFIYLPHFHEGLCGILAGHICEETRLPTFVMTEAADGTIKGSARCQDNADVFSILQAASEELLKFGGHKCAAGFSFSNTKMMGVFNLIEAAAPAYGERDSFYYDLEALPFGLPAVYTQLTQIGVYGTGLPLPVIKITGAVDEPKFIGAEKTHLSFKMAGINYIAFSLAEKYKQSGCPERMTVYATLGTNWWKGRQSIQADVIDITEVGK